MVRAENELRAAAARRSAADPFALLCPGRRRALSLPRAGAAATAARGATRVRSPSEPAGAPAAPGPAAPATPDAAPPTRRAPLAGPGKALDPGEPGAAATSVGAAEDCGRRDTPNGSAAPVSQDASASTAAAAQRGSPDADAVKEQSGAGRGAGAETEAEGGAAEGLAANGHAASCGGGAAAAAEAGGNERPADNGGGAESGRTGTCGAAPSPGVAEANGRGGSSAPGARPGRAPRFVAAVLDAQASQAAAATRDCAVFIVPQVLPGGPPCHIKMRLPCTPPRGLCRMCRARRGPVVTALAGSSAGSSAGKPWRCCKGKPVTLAAEQPARWAAGSRARVAVRGAGGAVGGGGAVRRAAAGPGRAGRRARLRQPGRRAGRALATGACPVGFNE